VRAKIANLLLEEVKQKNLDAMIVRAADFYGPGAKLSLTYSTITEKLKNRKNPQWVGDPNKVHTFTYTPDAGKTVAILGNTPIAYNQTWHALTSKERMTGVLYAKMASQILNIPEKKIQALPKFGVRLMGLFVPVLREFVEMMYQFEEDYFFDSSKLEKAFQLKATNYLSGIESTLKD
jgi:nucleoside-diphosphate-sugar epimerase